MWRTSLALILVMAAPRPAASADYLHILPSYRYLTTGSPLAPRSPEECSDLRETFETEVAELSAQHDACLEGSPPEAQGSAGCSKVSCQPLHTARDEARQREGEQTSICEQRLARYLAEKQAEERRERAEVQEQEARRARAQQATEEDDPAGQQGETGRLEQSTQHEWNGTARESSVNEAQGSDPAAEIPSPLPETARRLSTTYARARELFDQTKLAAEVAAELGSNPFDGAQAQLLGDVADKMDRTLLANGLDASMPDAGDATSDASLDQVHAEAGIALGKLPSTNPFAKAIAGLALSGISHIQNKVLGAMDDVVRQAASIETGSPESGKASLGATTATPTPHGTQATGTAESAAIDRNPFATHSNDDGLAAPPDEAPPVGSRETARVENGSSASPPAADSGNPFARRAPAGESTYFDPASRRTLKIPADYTLLRDTKGGLLHVGPMPPPGLRQGDLAQCSPDGVGIVRPACETQRSRAKRSSAG